MEAFSEFVRGFCIIAVSGGLIMLMAPNGNLKKYVKFIISLCMVCALLSAFFTFSENAEGFFDEIETETENEAGKTKEELYASVAGNAKSNLEAELCKLISAHISVPREDVYVVVRLDTSDFSAVEISEINVFLADISSSDAARVYLSEMFMGAVQINIRQKG